MCFCAVRRKCLVSHNCGKVRLPQTFRPTKGFRLCKHRQVIVSPQLLTILMLEIASDYCCWCHCFVDTATASNTTPNSLVVVWLEIWSNNFTFFDKMLNTFCLPRKRRLHQILTQHPRRIRVAILSFFRFRFSSWRYDSLTSFRVHTGGLSFCMACLASKGTSPCWVKKTSWRVVQKSWYVAKRKWCSGERKCCWDVKAEVGSW